MLSFGMYTSRHTWANDVWRRCHHFWRYKWWATIPGCRIYWPTIKSPRSIIGITAFLHPSESKIMLVSILDWSKSALLINEGFRSRDASCTQKPRVWKERCFGGWNFLRFHEGGQNLAINFPSLKSRFNMHLRLSSLVNHTNKVFSRTIAPSSFCDIAGRNRDWLNKWITCQEHYFFSRKALGDFVSEPAHL